MAFRKTLMLSIFKVEVRNVWLIWGWRRDSTSSQPRKTTKSCG